MTSHSQSRSLSEFTEPCSTCQTDTVHDVRIEVRQESADDTYSRQPHRIAVCQSCGESHSERMGMEF